MVEVMKELKKFDISNIKNNSKNIMIGMQGTGKSFLIKHIILEKKLNNGYIISPNYEESYNELLPLHKITNTYDNIKMEKIINENNNENMYIIIEKYFTDSRIYYDSSIHRILNDDKILSIFTLQYAMGINIELLKKINYIFIFRNYHKNSQKSLYKFYVLSSFLVFEDFSFLMDNYFENDSDYKCLIFDNIEKIIYWYKIYL